MPTMQFCSTVMLWNRLKDWNTMPTFARYALGLVPLRMFCPWNRITPSVGVSSRLMQRRSVDLPEPEAPMMHTTSLGKVSKSMSMRTSLSPNRFRRCRT